MCVETRYRCRTQDSIAVTVSIVPCDFVSRQALDGRDIRRLSSTTMLLSVDWLIPWVKTKANERQLGSIPLIPVFAMLCVLCELCALCASRLLD